MDVFKTVQRIANFGKYVFVSLIFLQLIGFAAAQDIGTTLNQLCTTILGVFAVSVMLMIILAAVTYAVGQVMGAETRARATVWATAMFTGAIVAALIYMLVPAIITGLTGQALVVGQCPAVGAGGGGGG